jgi:hypothetical protein
VGKSIIINTLAVVDDEAIPDELNVDGIGPAFPSVKPVLSLRCPAHDWHASRESHTKFSPLNDVPSVYKFCMPQPEG